MAFYRIKNQASRFSCTIGSLPLLMEERRAHDTMRIVRPSTKRITEADWRSARGLRFQVRDNHTSNCRLIGDISWHMIHTALQSDRRMCQPLKAEIERQRVILFCPTFPRPSARTLSHTCDPCAVLCRFMDNPTLGLIVTVMRTVAVLTPAQPRKEGASSVTFHILVKHLLT